MNFCSSFEVQILNNFRAVVCRRGFVTGLKREPYQTRLMSMALRGIHSLSGVTAHSLLWHLKFDYHITEPGSPLFEKFNFGGNCKSKNEFFIKSLFFEQSFFLLKKWEKTPQQTWCKISLSFRLYLRKSVSFERPARRPILELISRSLKKRDRKLFHQRLAVSLWINVHMKYTQLTLLFFYYKILNELR